MLVLFCVYYSRPLNYIKPCSYLVSVVTCVHTNIIVNKNNEWADTLQHRAKKAFKAEANHTALSQCTVTK